jgi:hypothetical protein
MYELYDVYLKDGVYYVVTEFTQTRFDRIYKSIPLSRWILHNHIGSTEDARNLLESMMRNAKEAT